MDPAVILKFIQEGGTAGALLIFIVGLQREWWVTGGRFREMQKDRDRWMEMTTKLLDISHRAVDTVKLASSRESEGQN